MKKLPYHYTNLAKQIFIITLILYFVMRFVIIAEIVIFKLDGFYESVNIPIAIIEFAVIFGVLIAFLFGHKFCYSLYDENTLIYRNKLLRKEKRFELSNAGLAVLGTFGIKFYASPDANEKEDKPIFFLPFFRDGIIEAVPLNNFYKTLIAREDMKVIKKFQVLPGYTKKWRFVAIAYGFLAVIVFMSLATPITVIVVLFQSH